MPVDFYLSSTYSDLRGYRDAAVAAVRTSAERSKKRHVDYELFDPSALPHQGAALLDTCLAQVKAASYFILLLGWRHADGSGRSPMGTGLVARVAQGRR